MRWLGRRSVEASTWSVACRVSDDLDWGDQQGADSAHPVTV